MRKLWNRPSLAVWSLITVDEAGTPNANICTYVTSVSLTPKLMLIAVYHGTKTLANLTSTRRARLCLLSVDQASLVRICGRTSGHHGPKFPRLKRHPTTEDGGLPYFTDACGYLDLEITSLIDTDGDHQLALARVISSRNLSDRQHLTTDHLRAHGLIR